jgi:hypothetical protein
MLIEHNAIRNNHEGGLVVWPPATRVRIVSNTITGNGQDGRPTDCGLWNAVQGQLDARFNYWGAPTGPGPDPADTVCNAPGAETLVTPFLPFSIP